MPCHQSSNPDPVLDYNTTNPPDLPSNNNKEDISPGASHNGEEKIKPADMDNNKEDIRPADIDEQRPATPNRTPRNGLLSELSSTFREVTFSEAKFPADTLVSDTRYEHPRSQNNNLFYLFNGT